MRPEAAYDLFVALIGRPTNPWLVIQPDPPAIVKGSDWRTFVQFSMGRSSSD